MAPNKILTIGSLFTSSPGISPLSLLSSIIHHGAGEEYSEAYLHESCQSIVTGVAIFYIVMQTITLALRQLSKYIGGLCLGWDDFPIALGFVLCVTVDACSLDDVYSGGVGLHEARVKEIDPEMLVLWGHWIIIIPLLYFSAVVPAKLAIIHLYLHTFTDKRIRITFWIVAAIIMGNWVDTTIAGFLACHPMSYFWTQKGKCFNLNAFFRWSGLGNVLTHTIMLVLPMPMEWNLHASIRLKLGIAFAFSLGSIGLISSILRFYEFYVTNANLEWSQVCFVVCDRVWYLSSRCLFPDLSPASQAYWT
ncbi:integral membrane protein [Penicillium malachiteum]|uniref:Integral membrane protein n=1 Tax=Penicillium malachiteum TaxID=1324776 RepID=A0AAD6MWI6_9EURO|nr:integral membrane protein [Penicillium malachiteum]